MPDYYTAEGFDLFRSRTLGTGSQSLPPLLTVPQAKRVHVSGVSSKRGGHLTARACFMAQGILILVRGSKSCLRERGIGLDSSFFFGRRSFAVLRAWVSGQCSTEVLIADLSVFLHRKTGSLGRLRPVSSGILKFATSCQKDV